MFERLWRRLADHYLPSEELRRIGRVHFVPIEYDQWRRGIKASGGICIPAGTSVYSSVVMVDNEWPGFRRWPSFLEMLPRFTAARGGIQFVRPPSVR